MTSNFRVLTASPLLVLSYLAGILAVLAGGIWLINGRGGLNRHAETV